MKKTFALLLTVIFLSGCGYVELRNTHLQRPTFDNQRVINLTQSTFNFHPSYKVYSVDYQTFMLPEDREEGFLYHIKKTYDLFNDKYVIINKKTKSKTYFTNDTDDDRQRNRYGIYDETGDYKITVSQKFFDKYENYKMEFAKDESCDSYDITIKYNERNEKSPHDQELHSVEMTVTDGETVLLKLFKQQKYFTNRVEIFINDDYRTFTDEQSIGLGVCFDYILKNIGISYRE